MEMLKEKFAKLLLGEDMSGRGTGVPSALALSNAITNLAASVWGEQYRLEPMSAERKARWRKEIDWLLSVTDYIVEFVASQQTLEDGRTMEIMTTQQRKDLRMNIPALRKLDAMLIGYLDNFKDQKEFWYLSRDAKDSEKGKRADDKWWLPTVKVPENGLPEESRKWIQHQKELVSQVLKAAMAINANVLIEMDIPEDYIENLPKNGRSSLGDSLYKVITDEGFDADAFLETLDLSTEHKILDLKNRIEASVVIWKRKMNNKDVKSSWVTVAGVSGVSQGKREQFEDRAETILLILKHRFPGIPQSALDISKIELNKDVGLAILESYSRVLESLAFTVISRIEDVLRADNLARNPPEEDVKRKSPKIEPEPVKAEEVIQFQKLASNDSMTLSDFMDWQMDQDAQESNEDSGTVDNAPGLDGAKSGKKSPKVAPNKRYYYLDKLVNWDA
ncbi:rop guanine nucleotide exchange factor 12-like [Curcuma longa]|uniref:rop guanine nucleotide exchange factor 12-like n=1 Tax=Curcuma longa TaxID=136217 RepID=UPI003D9E55DD